MPAQRLLRLKLLLAATCHDMAVLHQGQVRFRGSPAALVQEAAGQVWELELSNGQEPDPDWRIASRVQEAGGLKLRLIGANPGGSARPVKPTLEEAYLVLMRDEIRPSPEYAQPVAPSLS